MKEPKGVAVQAFSPDLIEIPAGQWRFIRYEPCPLSPQSRRHCKDENHHFGRGDHLIPLNPEWKVGDTK